MSPNRPQPRRSGKHEARDHVSATTGAVHLRSVTKSYRRRGVGTRHAHDDVMAVDNVTFDVTPGEMLGLVGVNGSGKSTLLRICAGVSEPTSGVVSIGGRVAGILSLGDGFHTLLTGRENAMTAAILAGMSRREAAARLPQILDFSELGDAIDDPVRTYSAGMFVRLAYSVAAHVDADVLLVDEALAVGDLAFATKCLDHLDALRRDGTTILLASHDIDMVRATCDRVAWIDKSELRNIGEPVRVVEDYRQSSHVATRELTPPGRAAAGQVGSGAVEIIEVRFLTDRGGDTIGTGESATVEVSALTTAPEVSEAIVSMSLHDADGNTLLDLAHPVDLSGVDRRSHLELALDRLDLAAGDYSVAVGVHAPEFLHAYDYVWEAARFRVLGIPAKTAFAPPHRWRAR